MYNWLGLIELCFQKWKKTIPPMEAEKGKSIPKKSRAQRALLPAPAAIEPYWSWLVTEDEDDD